ncbi:MAG: Flp family type IVb pilin [Alphaproteobacteria bacterium]
MFKLMRMFLRAENGATAIEYGLIAGLVFLVIVGAVETLGKSVADTLYTKIALILQ